MHDHRDVTTVDEVHLRNPIAQHNRDIDHLVEGMDNDRVKLVQELHLRNLHRDFKQLRKLTVVCTVTTKALDVE